MAAAACGGSPKPTPSTTPLPDDTKPAPVAATPTPPPTPPPAPPGPPKPVDIKVPASQTTVKLVSGGKGKREPLRYAAKEGAKQNVELTMDFTGSQDAEEQTLPTMVLTASAEAKPAAGGFELALTVTAADAREAITKPDAPKVDLNKFKAAMAVLPGLAIGGSLASNGVAGELTLHMDNPPPHADQVVDLVRVTLPRLPPLPAEPIGVGAKWQATTTLKVADRLEVTQVTDYEVTAHKGTAWTVKGTTKVTGKEQTIEASKVSDISGSGTTEATIDSAGLLPAFKSSVETLFKSTQESKTSSYKVRVGGGIK
ncbi:MAG TPA: hypothetical protein VGC42_22870 [Kofleriaceae bacterium]